MRTLLATKLNLPQASSDQIVRTRLLLQLNAGLEAPASRIIGPAGAGKSTLAAAWLRTLIGHVDMIIARPSNPRPRLRTAWLTLDDGDDDPVQFLFSLLAAIRTASPHAFATVFAAVEREELTAPEQIVDAIIAESATLSSRVIVALDDYHTLTNPAIHAALARLIGQTSPSLHFLVISREEPPFAAELLRDGRESVLLQSKDLYFTADESARFLRGAVGPEIADDLIREIHARTEGWPVGLRLAALSLRHAADPAALTSEALQIPTEWVAEYLAEAVFTGQSDTVRRFLLYTALPEQFSIGLATALLDEASPLDVMATLDWVERRNIPLTRLDARGEWYRYHVLVREFLLQHLNAIATPAEIAALHGRAAAWLARTDRFQPALRHFIEAGDAAGAARLVEGKLPEYQEHANWPEFAACLNRLPEDLIRSSPGLLLARAWVLHWMDRPAAMSAAVERAAMLLDANPAAGALSPEHLRGQIALLRSVSDYGGRSIATRLHHADAALALLPQPSAAWMLARQTKVRLLARVGRVVDVRRVVDAADEAAASPTSRNSVQGYAEAAIAHVAESLAAQEQQAREWLAAAEAAGRPMDALWAHVALGGAYYHMNMVEASLEHWEFTLEQGARLSLDQLALFARLSMELCAQLGRLDRAEQIFHRVRDAFEASGSARQTGADVDLAAYLALLRGEREPVERWLAAQPAAPDPDPTSFSYALRLFALLALGTPQTLARATSDALTLLAATPPGLVNARLGLLVLLSAALWQSGRHDAALGHFRAALREGYPLGYRRVYLFPGAATRDMLAALSADATLVEAARDLAAKLPARPAIPPLPLPPPTLAPLTNRELEVLLLMAEKFTNPEIARRLRISPNTVRNQTAGIYRKLNVSRRQEAVAVAREIGLIH